MSAVPKLRFSEFDGEWEKRSLGAVSEKPFYGMNSEATSFDGLNKYIRITDIDETTRKFGAAAVTSPSGGADAKYKLKEGDIVFARTGASVGKSYLYNEDDGNLLFAGFLIKFHISKAHPKFVFFYTLTSQYGRWVIVNSARSGQPGINAEEYKLLEISFPSLPEQKKIASFLSSVDKKIDLLRQKKDALELYKKGLMQKVFSQKIRFKQDDGSVFPDWEEVAFERLAERKSDRHKSGSADVLKIIELENIQSSQGSLTGEIQEKIPSLNNHIFQANDVLFGKLRPYLKKWFFAKFSGACSSEIWVLRARQGVESEFLYYLVQSELFLSLTQMSSGSKMPRADWKVIADSDFQLPSLAEQVKVSRLLAGIDQKISKLAAFSDQMETFKKGLLQQMFV